MKTIARYTFVVLATLGILALLWEFRGAITAFLLSLFIGATIRPLIAWLVERGINALAAQLLVFLGILVGGGVLVYSLGPAVANDLGTLVDESIRAYDTLYTTWLGGEAWQQAVVARLPAAEQIIATIAGRNGGQMMGTLLGVTQGLLGFVSDSFLIVILSIYWSQDQNRFERLWLSLLSPQARIHARNAWRTTEDVVGQFIRSEVIQSVLVAVVLAVAFRYTNMPYPTLMALLAGMLWVVVWLVPNVGMIVIGGIIFGVGLLNGLTAAALATVCTVLVLGIVEWQIEPRLFDRHRFSSVLTLLLMIPLVSTTGVVGLLIAPPFAAALQTIGSEAIKYASRPRDTDVQFDGLQSRYNEVHDIFANDQGQTFPPEIGSILRRLKKLMSEAERVVE